MEKQILATEKLDLTHFITAGSHFFSQIITRSLYSPVLNTAYLILRMNVFNSSVVILMCSTLAASPPLPSLYCPVTSITSSSELLPPFSEPRRLSGWERAAPNRLEVGLLNCERKLVELELGTGNPPDPGMRGLGNILGSDSSDWQKLRGNPGDNRLVML